MKQLIFWHVTADSTRVGYTVAHLPGRSPWRLLLSFLCFTKGGILWTVPARVSAMIVLRENPFPFKTRCPLTLHSLVWETRDDRLDIHAYASVETPLHPLTALPPKRPRSFPGLSLLVVRARDPPISVSDADQLLGWSMGDGILYRPFVVTRPSKSEDP